MALEHRQIAPVYAVQYALRVLEAVDNHRHGVTTMQLSREIGIPVNYLSHLLTMLKREHYLSLLPGGAYVIGESLALLGSAHREHAQSEKLKSALTELRDEVGAAVYYCRYVEGELKVIEFADSPDMPRVNEWVDFRFSAHAMALGKCLLAQLDHDSRRDHLARHKTPRLTSRTIISERLLLAKLDSQPASAPSLDWQEYAVGTVCAAVPVTLGTTVGSLALSLPISQAHRLKPAADTLGERAAPVLLSFTL